MTDRFRKRIVSQGIERVPGGQPEWLDLGALAVVEVSSEDPDHPIEHALLPQHESGWMASETGSQVIRILFDQPQKVGRVYLHFEHPGPERTQEFVLRWAASSDGPTEEIVRQRWNFSPTGSTHEIEDFHPSPREVALVELEIIPDVSGADARASVQQLRLA